MGFIETNAKNIMIMLVCLLGGIAAYMIIATVLKLPTRKSVQILDKAMLGNAKQVDFADLARKLAKHIKLDEFKKEKLERALELDPQGTTPEECMAQIYILSFLISLIGLVFILISKPMAIIGVLLGPVMGYLKYQEIFKKLKEHKASIEREIPRFAQSIHENLKVSRDVLAILTSYQSIANKALGYELEKTIADMKTSNYESALMRLDARIGSQNLSELIRGLIGALRGNDQTTYFEHLAYEMRHLEENMIRKEAMKRPDKMHILSMAMLVGILLMVGAVCGTMLIESFSVFNGAGTSIQ